MDIVYITQASKLRQKFNIIIREYFIEGSNSSIKDSTGSHKLHYIVDCFGSMDNSKINASVDLLKEIIGRNDYLIIRHKNMHQEIIDAITSEQVDSDRVIMSRHEPNDPLNKWYVALPGLVTDSEFTREILAQFDKKERENAELNKKLSLLYKLLGDKPLNNDEKIIAAAALPNFQEEIKEDKIEGLKKLRGELLKDLV